MPRRAGRGYLLNLLRGVVPREGVRPKRAPSPAPGSLFVRSGAAASALPTRRDLPSGSRRLRHLPGSRASLHPPLPGLAGSPYIIKASLTTSWEYPHEHLQINCQPCHKPKESISVHHLPARANASGEEKTTWHYPSGRYLSSLTCFS